MKIYDNSWPSDTHDAPLTAWFTYCIHNCNEYSSTLHKGAHGPKGFKLNFLICSSFEGCQSSKLQYRLVPSDCQYQKYLHNLVRKSLTHYFLTMICTPTNVFDCIHFVCMNYRSNLVYISPWNCFWHAMKVNGNCVIGTGTHVYRICEIKLVTKHL